MIDWEKKRKEYLEGHEDQNDKVSLNEEEK